MNRQAVSGRPYGEVAHAENTKLATQAVNEAMGLKVKSAKSVERARPYFTAGAYTRSRFSST